MVLVLRSILIVGDVLLVDDDLDVCWAVEQFLLLKGHTVRVAHDGEEGLKRLAEKRPDIVLLDIEMPILNGPQMAYRMFVENCGMENVPIVLVSGFAGLTQAASRVGTPYFLAKPFDPLELMNLVERALRERALPRPSP